MSKWIRYPYSGLRLSLFVVALVWISGCGGGTPAPKNVTTRKGQVQIALTWPETLAPTRLIPIAAQSVKLVVRKNNEVEEEKVLVRPTAPPWITKTTMNAPLGAVTVSASAYPTTDGTGVAQASATVAVEVLDGQETPVKLTMASTIARLEATPATLNVRVQETKTFTVVPRDAENQVVLVAPGGLRYTLSGPDDVVMDAQRQVTGIDVCEATISVTETESGKSTTIPVKVQRSGLYRITWIGGLPYAVRSVATALNDKGVVVGYSDIPRQGGGTQRRSWIWKPDANFQGGALSDMGPLLDSNQIEPSGINDSNVVCGTVDTTETPGQPLSARAWSWRDGAYTLLPIASIADKRYRDWATGINKQGEVLGNGTLLIPNFGSDIKHPVLWTNLSDAPKILAPTSGFAEGYAINEVGYLTGVSINWTETNSYTAPRTGEISRLIHPFEYSFFAEGMALNNRNQVVGWTYQLDKQDGFNGIKVGGQALLWKDKYWVKLGALPGHLHSKALGINDQGTIIGESYREKVTSDDADIRAFHWRYGKLDDLSTLIPQFLLTPEMNGRPLHSAKAINQKGQITGYGFHGAYLLTPQKGGGNVNVGVH